ncbi:MAG TPA: tetratricopeptide repeat protein [Isosphaeraceae bacterium]|jgi:tetratricopeptide (TPR) repeat protein|nr:tetratricopeptide repeat protein [Isosphaeraceae bacterium]
MPRARADADDATRAKPKGKAKGAPRAIELPPEPAPARWVDGALVVGFLALTFLLGVFPQRDMDIWWHLRTGDLIRQGHGIPEHDLYTFTVPDHPWIDLHWGFEVAASWAFAHGGMRTLQLAKCAITCLAVFLLITARRRDWPLWAMLTAWLPALVLLGGRMYVRPETVTLLFLAAFLAVLVRWERFPKLAYALPAIQMLWVNTQGLFVLGPIVLALAMIDAALRPGAFARARTAWWRAVAPASVLTLVACFLNPYAIEGVLFPVQLATTMRSPVFSNSIAELEPIPQFIARNGLNHPMLLLHLGVMALGALSFLVPLLWQGFTSLREPPDVGKKKKGGPMPWRVRPFRLLLFAAFSALSLQATRNSHQFAAVVGAVTAWNLGEWAATARGRRLASGAKDASGLPPRLIALALIAATIAAISSGAWYAVAGEGRTVGLGEDPLWQPHAAARFAGKEGMPDRAVGFHLGMAALYEFYHGPDRKVFADPRLEVMGPELYEHYNELGRRLGSDAPGWAEELDALGRPALLIDHETGFLMEGTLLAGTRWRCVYWDPAASVFLHESSLAAADVVPVDFLVRHFRPDPGTEPHGLRALLAESKALARLVEARPALARALAPLGIDHARRVLRNDPDSTDGWKDLGRLLAAGEPAHGLRPSPRMGGGPAEPLDATAPRFRLPFDPVFDLTPARVTFAFRRALDRSPGDPIALLSLADAYLARRMDEAALPFLERLADSSPSDPRQAAARELASYNLGLVRGRLGPAPKPVEHPNLSALDKALDELLERGRAASAADLIEREYPPKARPWPLADRLATLRLHLGEPDRARAAWQAATAPRPALRAARVAATYLAEDDLDRARASYREALAAEPDLFEALYGLAVVEHAAGRAADTLDAARRAESHAPGPFARDAARALARDATPYVSKAIDPSSGE